MRLKIGLTQAASQSGLLVAHDGGIFERHGLDVELVNLGAGQPAQAALISGELTVAAASGTSSVSAMLAGAPIVVVAAVFDTLPYQMISTRDVAAMEDLRGKTVGINRLGGAPHAVLRYLLRQSGVDVDREATVIQIGQQPERLAALRSGAIQATLISPPFGAMAERDGLRLLADAGELGLPYPTNVLAMSRPWLASQRDVARRVVQGLVDGTRAYKADRELGIRTIQRWRQVDDPVLLEDTYLYFRRVIQDEVLPRPEGIRLVIDEIAADLPEARNLRPDEVVAPSLAREVQ